MSRAYTVTLPFGCIAAFVAQANAIVEAVSIAGPKYNVRVRTPLPLADVLRIVAEVSQ